MSTSKLMGTAAAAPGSCAVAPTDQPPRLQRVRRLVIAGLVVAAVCSVASTAVAVVVFMSVYG